MKKNSSKRILSVILTLALALSMGDAVLAAEPEPQMTEGMSEGTNEKIIKELETGEISAMSNDIEPMMARGNAISVLRSVSGQEQPVPAAITFSNTEDFRKTGTNYFGYSQEVELSKGTLVLTVGNYGASYGYVYYGLWEDENLTQKVEPEYMVDPGKTGQKIFQISENKKYYIGVYGYSSSAEQQGSAKWAVVVTASFYNGNDREVKNGQVIAVGQKDPQTNYFKFVAPSTGYIQTYGDKTAAGYNVALCDGSKNALSGDTCLRYNPTYGVTKGKTYYLRVKSSYNSDGGYSFRVNSTKISEKSGKKKAKAVTLKKKKAKSGTIQAGSGQADWYKFKLSGKKKVKITVNGRTNDQMKVIVYKGGKKIVTRTIYYSDAKLTLKSVGKWTKGTYYIKIQRGNGTSSGYYSVKWK